jgi:hypothetical protein
VTIFTFYTPIASVAISMFSCIPVCGKSYWILDINLRCPWESVSQPQWQWAVGVGVPAVLFSAVVPVFVVAWLMHALRTGSLTSAGFVQRYGFLYSNYRIDFPTPQGGSIVKLLTAARRRVNIAWDAVVHCQTLLLVFTGVYGTVWHEFYQTLLLSSVLGAYLLLVVMFRPFRLPSSQCLQAASFAVLCMTCTCVLSFIRPDALDQRQEDWYKQAGKVIAVFVMVSNGLFLVVTLGLLLWCVLPFRRRRTAVLNRAITI